MLAGIGPRTLKKGDLVFVEGQPSDGIMYFIFSGELLVTKNINGEQRGLRTMKDGEFFGEMALVNNRPRTATVRVHSQIAKLGGIDRRTFALLGKSKPAFLFSLLRTVAARVADAEDRLNRLVAGGKSGG
jgi:CRP/FNR family transcriptional regulator, cyclic AMP receptor protein